VSLINDTADAVAGSVLYDVQQVLPGYPCTNKAEPLEGGNCLEDYDFRYPGAETLRYALAGSRNVPAVKAMLTVGVNKVIQTADSLMDAPNAYNCYADTSLTVTAPCYGSAAIGDGAYLTLVDHVNGDATLARQGQSIPQTFILKITDASNNTVYQWTQPKPKQVVRTDAAWIVDDMLDDPRASYLPGSCTSYTCTPLSEGGYKFQHYNGWDIDVKTGTTNDNFDGLMTAWDTQFAVVSWVGNHTRNVALAEGQMEYLTEPLTRNLQEQALDSLHETPVNYKEPSDIKTLPAYVVYNHIGIGSEEPSPSTDVYPSWYVAPKANTGNEVIDKVSGMLATSCTPALARENEGNNSANIFSIDIFYGGTTASANASAAGGTDDIHNCNDTLPSVSVTEVSCDDTNKCDFQVVVTQGTHALSGGTYTASPAGTISLTDNGKTVQTVSIPNGASSPYNTEFCSVSVNNGDTIGASAVDSVLYSATAATVTADTTNPTTNSC
jgi:membrane peptidoglycan carboxypeptidase